MPQTDERLQEIVEGWQPIETGPRNATNVKLRLLDGTEVIGHWASDLSGSDQPPFQGWFVEGRDKATGKIYGFREVWPIPTHWQPLAATTKKGEGE